MSNDRNTPDFPNNPTHGNTRNLTNVGSQYYDDDPTTARILLAADDATIELLTDLHNAWQRDHNVALGDATNSMMSHTARALVANAVEAKRRRDEVAAREYTRGRLTSDYERWARRIDGVLRAIRPAVADALLTALKVEVIPFTGDDDPRLRLTIPATEQQIDEAVDLLLSVRFNARENTMYIDQIEAPYALSDREREYDHYNWPTIHLNSGPGIADDVAALVIWGQERIAQHIAQRTTPTAASTTTTTTTTTAPTTPRHPTLLTGVLHIGQRVRCTTLQPSVDTTFTGVIQDVDWDAGTLLLDLGYTVSVLPFRQFVVTWLYPDDDDA